MAGRLEGNKRRGMLCNGFAVLWRWIARPVALIASEAAAAIKEYLAQEEVLSICDERNYKCIIANADRANIDVA